MRKLLVLSFSLVVLGCATSDLTRNEMIVEEQAIQERFQAWVTAVNNREYADIDEKFMHTEDVSVVTPDGLRAVGWEAQEAAIRTYYQTINYVNFVPLAPEVRVINSRWAVVQYRHSTTTDFRMTGRSANAGWGLMLWEKDEDGVWRILTSQMSNNPVPTQ